MPPQGMCFLKFHHLVSSLPPEKPMAIEPPWPVYGKAEMRMAVHHDGKYLTFPLCGFDLRRATQPRQPVIYLTHLNIPWPDEAVARDVELQVAQFLRDNQRTVGDINKELGQASGRKT